MDPRLSRRRNLVLDDLVVDTAQIDSGCDARRQDGAVAIAGTMRVEDVINLRGDPGDDQISMGGRPQFIGPNSGHRPAAREDLGDLVPGKAPRVLGGPLMGHWLGFAFQGHLGAFFGLGHDFWIVRRIPLQ